MSCRSGCLTKDHSSWGECARAANMRTMGLESTGSDFTAMKRNDKELAAYRAARKEGIQPAGTKTHQIEAAVKLSDRVGKAFDATDGSFKA